MTVIKRSKSASGNELIKAVEQLLPFLRDQGEDEAVQDLEKAQASLEAEQPGSSGYRKAAEAIVDAFEGDHELIAYTFPRKKGLEEWTAVEELCNASSRVLNLAKRVQ